MTVASTRLPSIDRIRPAYAQVASQLRDIILGGDVAPGDRLPSEAEMASSFGVSRTTIREALRVLTSQGLLRTERGVSGGTFVSEVNAEHVSDQLEIGLNVLTGNERVSIGELLEIRETLEIPAVKMAAARRTDDDLVLLEQTMHHHHDVGQSVEGNFAAGRDFHLALVMAAHNRLMLVMIKPVFSVLEGLISQVRSADRVWRDVPDDHALITRAIRDRNEKRAATLMLEHLGHLRSAYKDEGLLTEPILDDAQPQRR